MGRTIAKRLFQTLTLLTLKFLTFNLNQASSTSNEFNRLVLPKLNCSWACMLECIELQNVDWKVELSDYNPIKICHQQG